MYVKNNNYPVQCSDILCSKLDLVEKLTHVYMHYNRKKNLISRTASKHFTGINACSPSSRCYQYPHFTHKETEM